MDKTTKLTVIFLDLLDDLDFRADNIAFAKQLALLAEAWAAGPEELEEQEKVLNKWMENRSTQGS